MTQIFTSIWHFIIWHLLHFSGLRSIWLKIKPNKKIIEDDDNYKKPATFCLWFVGIYVALFGIASNRYENGVEKVELRMNAIVTQLSNKEAFKNLISSIPKVQARETPVEPFLFNPKSVVLSLFREQKNPHIINYSIQTIETWKNKLQGVNLRDVILEGANLREADLEEANLRYAQLQGIDFSYTNLQGANLYNTNLKSADLYNANFEDSDLYDANLEDSDLYNANLQGANLYKANLQGAKDLTSDQLSKSYTLYQAKLDPELLQEIKQKYPHLLEKPKKN